MTRPKSTKLAEVVNLDDMANDFARASRAAADRRAELQLTQLEVGERMKAFGVNVETYRRFERAEKKTYRLTTLSAISIALGWPGDALLNIARGEDPPPPPSELDLLRERVLRLEGVVSSLALLVDRLGTVVEEVQ